MTIQEWRDRAVQLFGADEMNWRFVCPGCGWASVQDWKNAGAPDSRKLAMVADAVEHHPNLVGSAVAALASRDVVVDLSSHRYTPSLPQGDEICKVTEGLCGA